MVGLLTDTHESTARQRCAQWTRAGGRIGRCSRGWKNRQGSFLNVSTRRVAVDPTKELLLRLLPGPSGALDSGFERPFVGKIFGRDAEDATEEPDEATQP